MFVQSLGSLVTFQQKKERWNDAESVQSKSSFISTICAEENTNIELRSREKTNERESGEREKKQ